MPAPALSVVIPAYNEARRLPTTLRKVLDYLTEHYPDFELIVVDDGSTDDTVAVAREVIGDEPRGRVIENEHFGKGYTVRTGMLAATGKIVLFSDADLSTPIEDVERLLPWFEQGYDVVFGSREGGSNEQRVGEPFYRHLMGRIFNTLVRVIAVRGVQDTQCGFKALTHAATQDLFPRLLVHDGSGGPITQARVTGFDVELLYLAQKLGYRLKEVPVRWFYGKESKVNPARDSFLLFRDLVQVRLNAVRGRYDTKKRS